MSHVMIGMSGGVDSSVAAALMQEQKYTVTGVTLKLHNEMSDSGTCGSASEALFAQGIAKELGFEHVLLDYSNDFDHYVISDFINEYMSGRTPNPCTVCNKHIKFGAMLDYALREGAEYVATGHYAKCVSMGSRMLLTRAKDPSKDQTYMLWGLTQEQLKHVQFPLGNLLKSEVREIAAERGFMNADKPDSQDICFVPNGDYAEFIERRTGQKAKIGDFIDIAGNVLGKNNGVIRYTIGQRKGLGIALGKPAFVVNKDAVSGNVTLGENTDLFSRRVNLERINLIAADKFDTPILVQAKIRYNGGASGAVFTQTENGGLLEFKEPQRAVTPGQSAVFYDGDTVIGGGIIV